MQFPQASLRKLLRMISSESTHRRSSVSVTRAADQCRDNTIRYHLSVESYYQCWKVLARRKKLAVNAWTTFAKARMRRANPKGEVKKLSQSQTIA
jgi:hypothetical protein